jgi:hypothetical protein
LRDSILIFGWGIALVFIFWIAHCGRDVTPIPDQPAPPQFAAVADHRLPDKPILKSFLERK